MKLREFLLQSRKHQKPLMKNEFGVPIPKTKEEIREDVRTEYEFLSRRLKMLFGRTPCFTFPITDFKNNEKNDTILNLDEKQKEAVYRIVSIFWYVVYLHFEGNPSHQILLERGIQIINKTANKKYSNDSERQRSYLSYFNDSRQELTDLYNYFRKNNSYYLIPGEVIGLSDYQLELIKRGDQLSETNKNTQKSIDIFEKRINKELKKRVKACIDGYADEDGAAYNSEISKSEEDLFVFLIDVVERNAFDSKRLHNNLSVLDEEDGKSLLEKIVAIYENDGIGTINRYIQAKSKKEFDERLNEIHESLAYTTADKAYNKYVKLYNLLSDLEKYEISDDDLLKQEKQVGRLIKMLEKYAEAKKPRANDLISSDEEYVGFLQTIIK